MAFSQRPPAAGHRSVAGVAGGASMQERPLRPVASAEEASRGAAPRRRGVAVAAPAGRAPLPAVPAVHHSVAEAELGWTEDRRRGAVAGEGVPMWGSRRPNAGAEAVARTPVRLPRTAVVTAVEWTLERHHWNVAVATGGGSTAVAPVGCSGGCARLLWVAAESKAEPTAVGRMAAARTAAWMAAARTVAAPKPLGSASTTRRRRGERDCLAPAGFPRWSAPWRVGFWARPVCRLPSPWSCLVSLGREPE